MTIKRKVYLVLEKDIIEIIYLNVYLMCIKFRIISRDTQIMNYQISHWQNRNNIYFFYYLAKVKSYQMP